MEVGSISMNFQRRVAKRGGGGGNSLVGTHKWDKGVGYGTILLNFFLPLLKYKKINTLNDDKKQTRTIQLHLLQILMLLKLCAKVSLVLASQFLSCA